MIDARRRQQAAPGEHPAGHHRAHRWHSPVRRGDDQGGAGGGERGRSAADRRCVPSPALAVPASLHASLMARLDRLGPAKEVAQIGAAIGREFSHALLAAVVRKPEAELAIGARPSHCSRFAVPAGRATACDLPVQARTGAGRGLRHAAARAATRASRSHRRNSRKPIRGHRREPAGAAGASLHRGWADREGRGLCGAKRDSGRWRARRLKRRTMQLNARFDQIATLPTTPVAAPRTDQVPSRSCKCFDAHQRLRGA